MQMNMKERIHLQDIVWKEVNSNALCNKIGSEWSMSASTYGNANYDGFIRNDLANFKHVLSNQTLHSCAQAMVNLLR